MLHALVVGSSVFALAQGPALPPTFPEKIASSAERIRPDLVELRRDLHRHPELAGQEIRTAAVVRTYLERLGLEVHAGIGGHGVVGVLRGKRPGRTLAWRADMDALPSTFPDPAPFKSEREGVRHGCGHDVHTAIGLGIANVLSQHKDQLSGTVLFIFQPAEETFEGAGKMLASPLFDRLKPEAVFALHVAPLPTGVVSCKEKEMYWSGRTLVIEIGDTKDADSAAAEMRRLLLQLSTQPVGSPYFDPATITSADHNPGNPASMYRDYLVLSPDHIHVEKRPQGLLIKAEVESSSRDHFPGALARLKALIQASSYAPTVKMVRYSESLPTVYNHPQETQASIRVLKAQFGEAVFQPMHGINPFSNDDFALFQERFGGVYFFLGASDFSKGIISAPHAPHFQVDEKVIAKGVTCFSVVLQHRLEPSASPRP